LGRDCRGWGLHGPGQLPDERSRPGHWPASVYEALYPIHQPLLWYEPGGRPHAVTARLLFPVSGHCEKCSACSTATANAASSTTANGSPSREATATSRASAPAPVTHAEPGPAAASFGPVTKDRICLKSLRELLRRKAHQSLRLVNPRYKQTHMRPRLKPKRVALTPLELRNRLSLKLRDWKPSLEGKNSSDANEPRLLRRRPQAHSRRSSKSSWKICSVRTRK